MNEYFLFSLHPLISSNSAQTWPDYFLRKLNKNVIFQVFPQLWLYAKAPRWVWFQIRSHTQWSIQAPHLTETTWSVGISMHYQHSCLPPSFPPGTPHQTTLLVARDHLFHASQGALVLVHSGLIKMFPSSCDRYRSSWILFDAPSQSKHLWNANILVWV